MTDKIDFREMTQALYRVVSAAPAERNWDAVRAFYHPEARLVRTGVDPDGAPFAHVFSLDAYIENVRQLLDAHAKIGPDDVTTALGDVEILKLLLRSRPDLDMQGKDRRGDRDTPLNTAIIMGRLDLVRLLLDAGADINAPGFLDDTPLVVAMQRKQTEIEDFLVARGAVLGRKPDDIALESILLDAVVENRANTVKVLLAAGVDPNSTGGRSLVQTLLSLATDARNVDIVRELLKAGADTSQWVGGLTPLERAEKTGDPAIVALLRAVPAK